MKLCISVYDNAGTQVHHSEHKTKFNPTEIVLEKPFEVDGYSIKAFALGVEREKIVVPIVSILKNYKTRDGKRVHLLTVTGQGTYPVVGFIYWADGSDRVTRWTKLGYIAERTECSDDLVEVK